MIEFFLLLIVIGFVGFFGYIFCSGDSDKSTKRGIDDNWDINDDFIVLDDDDDYDDFD